MPKAVKGHKHFLVTDLMGTLMGVKITKGCLGEREGGKLLLQEVKKRFPELKGTVVYVDSGFSGPDFENWVKKELGWEVRVVKKIGQDGIPYCEEPKPTKEQVDAAIKRAKTIGFVVIPKRWVVERTNAWMAAQRRLRVVYDQVTANIEGWNWLTMMRLLLRRSERRNALNTS